MSEDFKGKRARSMSEAFRRMYGPSERQTPNASATGVPMSMGAKVAAPVCSLCAEGDGTHVHMSPMLARDAVPTFLYVTTVPAPPCDSCRAEMSRHDDTHWTCTTEACPQRGQPVSAHLSGVYPAKLLP